METALVKNRKVLVTVSVGLGSNLCNVLFGLKSPEILLGGCKHPQHF